ncbi:MAG: FkbM family methyltransferase [Phycisphaerales bacterium]|nr:FkbM family methyltransferase [Phycisphaerales bacterium]
MYTSPVMIKLRNIARSMGLTRAILRLRGEQNYEERFGNAMLGAIDPGAVVWDVGANVGFYSQKFSDRAGPGGTVIAFEPVPVCFAELQKAVAGRANVRCVNAALGQSSGELTFDVGDGSANPNARVVEGGAPAAGKTLKLPVHTGDDAAAKLALPAPNFVKIDVEGFELEVVKGMQNLLRAPACRNVFIEVHFGLLQKRGLDNAAKQISGLLESLGFTVAWIDASHLHGRK